jgi:hypothetical protein
MSDLRLLEIRSLLKELDYTEEKYNYTYTLVNNADMKFTENVSQLLTQNQELQELYNSKNNNINSIIKNNDNIQEEKIIHEDKLRKLYREIVKQTHNDKSQNNKLNELYIEATDYYQANDKIGIYKICNFLNIEYEFDQNDIELIKEKIDVINKSIAFLKNTFAWKWYNSDSDNEKNKIIIQYLKEKLIF